MAEQNLFRFIGRTKELDIYKHWLMDLHATKILYFYDGPTKFKGGIGKTRLLEQCKKDTKEFLPEAIVIDIDFFNLDYRNGIAVAEHVYKKLKEVYPDWEARDFADELEKYHLMTRRDDIELPEIRSTLSTALVRDLQKLDAHLHQSHRQIIVFLDTFEFIQDNPSVATLASTRSFPDDYQSTHIRFVLAGRYPLERQQPTWQGRENEVHSIALEPFTLKETVDYINSQLIPIEESSPQAAALNELTAGRPILLGLASDIIRHNVLSLEKLRAVPPSQFEEKLVAEINNFDSPTNWILLFMAHAHHRFNFALLHWMLQETHLRDLVGAIDYRHLQELPNLSFVRRATNGEDFVLHEEMRSLINKYCWKSQDPNKSFRRAVSQCVIKYYEENLHKEENELLRQTYTLQILFHKLFLDLQEGMQYFKEHFAKALHRWLIPYASILLKEIQGFSGQLTPPQRYELHMEEARLFLKDSHPEKALANYEWLSKEAYKDWVEAHQAEIFYGFAECYLDLGDLEEAATWLNKMQPLAKMQNNRKQRANILLNYGYISRQLWELERAEAYYGASADEYRMLKDLREYANVLNSLGNIYHLQGKDEEAFTNCKISLHLREQLFKQGEGSEIAIGLSHNTIGTIFLHTHDIVNAEFHFNQARDIFIRGENKKWLAAIYNRLGQISIVKKDFSSALDHFQKAYGLAEHLDKETQINSLNKQGRIYREQEKYQEARSVLERAIEAAKSMHDFYQEAESEIDLGSVLACLQQFELAREVLEEGYLIAKKYRYYYLLGVAETFKGNLFFQSAEYKLSFSHYAEACRFMGLYNSLEFTRVVQSLIIDQLLKLSDSVEIKAILEELKTYWERQRLTRRFPEFLSACNQVSKLLILE